MKKLFTIILSLLFFVTLSFSVVSCKKAEEEQPAAVIETPAPETVAPEAAPEAAPAPAPEEAPATK